ncbi:MAG: nucleotide sugar dehydrogenase, partial [Candidatus Pacebacteria bacterium]|nr:nucleotide sugar dehydrogenase [Candidatus Paceibacterota bacterium]
IIQEELDKRGAAVDFWVVSNPEFMAEGRAVKDMLEPSRVVVGSNSKEVLAKMELLYDPFMKKTPRFHAMGVQAAELTKYASNTMLALKISFINTVAGLCDVISADIEEVAEGMGSDPRIGREFLHASLGYGGSCFPKDVKAIIVFADKIGLPKPYLSLLRAIEEVNKYQKTIIPRKILARFGADLTGKKFALWGLSFKAKTNDMRESASIDIVKILTARGAKIVAYDPLAVEEARTVYLKEFSDSISYEQSDKYAILDGCDALIIATETGEYRTIDITVAKKALKNSIIFDGRNLLDIPTLKEAGFEYYAVGRGDRIDWQKIEID